MRPVPVFFFSIFATGTVALVLAAQGAKYPNKQPLEPLRERIEFCSLLQHELRLNLVAGLTTEQRAEGIITSCFNTYNQDNQ